ncbi:ATP-binding protein [Mycobacterium timonense]|uniref:ATP-binding protein n=1 Tax=Mycobacterium bouchedurhonense TaxID=701041 RepID=A0AAW5SEI8_MYCBC|nr:MULTISPECIES: ATP-binding protein [Mycobacterium]MCV6993024.1 ATP-binding protein [Mycobacterium bouchedurhonense]MCV6994683.1 ATP-binding protein [Mycobacterium timonense]
MEALDYGLRQPEDKAGVADAHESLILNCPDDTLLLSLQAPLDLVDVMNRSLDQVDLQRTPDYIKEALDGYRRIAEIAPLTRIYTITFPIGKSQLSGDPSAQEIAAHMAAADELLRVIDPEGNFKLQPVPEGLLPFIWNHNLMRGSALEHAPHNPANASPSTAPPAIPFFQPGVLDEGARTEKPFRRSFDPMLKAMVRLDDGHVIDSYQAMLTPMSFPPAMAFPGHSEFLSILDGIPDVTVDWAMRVRRRDRESAIQLNEKQLGKLGIQLGERNTDVGFHSQELRRKVETLAAYNDSLATNENAQEVEFTTVLAVGAPTQADLTRSVGTLKAKFRRLGIRLDAPRGAQRRFWMMLNPGAPADSVYTDYQHITATPDWAGFVPFTTARLLDDAGPIIGVNLLSGLFEPLHFNFLNKVLSDISPAIAMAGELGSGKSYFTKTLISIVADLLGQFLVIDRSPGGEYVPLLESIPGSVLISLDDPRFTLDPLRIFTDPHRARSITLDTILPLLNIPVVSAPGVLLAEILKPEHRTAHRLHSLADVRDFLADNAAGRHGRDAEDQHTLVRAMDAVEAPVLFDRALKPMPLAATATVVRTHTLALPTVDELTLSHAYQNLPWRKRLGHALYELVGLLAREQFLKPGRFGALVVDEAYHFTATTVGKQIVEEFVRDGRKHSAGIILASHDPKADYATAAHNLIPNRFAFRQRNAVTAANTLEWLGVDIERDAYLIKQLRENTSPPIGRKETVAPNRRGECFIADGRGRIGRGKILGPARADRARAVSTTPQQVSI